MSRFFVTLVALACMTAAFAADIPVTDVVLFSSGVGYFQRSGTVKDNATVQLSFKTDQINDLLKSMVLLDMNGGTIGGVTYASKDPISKTLQSFAVNVTDNPSMADLLNRLRGVEIEVVANSTYTGKILGVEKKERQVGDDVITIEVLNIVTDKGIKSVRLDEVSSLRLLDERLNQELQDALLVLASGLDNQRKPVVVTFNGTGERRVVIGYLAETPIWKTSYRIVLGEKRALMQGWGIVENTSDSDWSNVRLSLVSGRPISFIQDLYTSLYIARPVVRPNLYSSVRPVEYEAGFAPTPFPEINVDGRVAGKALAPSIAADRIGPQGPQGPAGAPGLMGGGNAFFDRTEIGASLESSVVSAALARDLGQRFEYAIKDPVTLPRQKSAMLPIVAGNVDATRVSIYNPNVNQKYPLYGLKLKNSTGMNLMGGPITIYDREVYAGDATISDLQPGEERLLSYAIDLGVIPQRDNSGGSDTITAISLVKGVMTITRKHRQTTEYQFKAKDGKDRTVIVEHPFMQGWKLVKPEKPDEKTDLLYRFTVPVNAKDGGKLTVVEENIDAQGYRIVDLDTNMLVTYAQNGEVNQKVKDTLQHIITLQQRLIDIKRDRAAAEQEITTISKEQDRLRQNMGALDRNSDLYKRYVAKLGDQETRIEELRSRIEDLHEQEDAARKELEDYVMSLDLTQQL